jgi:hypothetical protein
VSTPESKIPPKSPNPDCDKKLAAIFGGPGAVAAGSGYEPPRMQRPEGGRPFSRESVAPGDASYGIHYNQLGNARDVTYLFLTLRITQIFGRITIEPRSVASMAQVAIVRSIPYIHSHLAILNSQKYFLRRVFCKS